MAKRKPIVWIDWFVSWDDDTSTEYLDIWVYSMNTGWHPDYVITRHPSVLSEVKEQLALYEQEFYADSSNFDLYGYERDVDYKFKLKPFDNDEIRKEVTKSKVPAKCILCCSLKS